MPIGVRVRAAFRGSPAHAVAAAPLSGVASLSFPSHLPIYATACAAASHAHAASIRFAPVDFLLRLPLKFFFITSVGCLPASARRRYYSVSQPACCRCLPAPPTSVSTSTCFSVCSPRKYPRTISFVGLPHFPHSLSSAISSMLFRDYQMVCLILRERPAREQAAAMLCRYFSRVSLPAFEAIAPPSFAA